MDAELEQVRCRRTDGRKWRCQLPVLPDQKYCERHVNRGRICSRKPVEVHNFLNPKSKSTATTSISLLKTTPNLQSHAKTKHNKASIKNQSLNIKKHSMENSRRLLEFDFSVKSVVQDSNDIALGVGASGNDHETAQSKRCRRTDGRKWRCKKDVLPGMKYCVQHMHRGVKKGENGQKLNPCLSFLVGASYQQGGGDGDQPKDSESSSEATTISM